MADNFSIYKQCQKNASIPNVTEKENRIPVTYLCWGCGSSVNRYEATDLPIVIKELWNLCPRCVALIKGKNKGEKPRRLIGNQ